jgi:rare lipoprotein A
MSHEVSWRDLNRHRRNWGGWSALALMALVVLAVSLVGAVMSEIRQPSLVSGPTVSVAAHRHHSKTSRKAPDLPVEPWKVECMASWYGPGRQCQGCPRGGRYTASGERFTGEDLTAAHRTLHFGTMVKVTNLKNGKSLVVRINDRGPATRTGCCIDLSRRAARELGITGRTRVRLELADGQR